MEAKLSPCYVFYCHSFLHEAIISAFIPHEALQTGPDVHESCSNLFVAHSFPKVAIESKKSVTNSKINSGKLVKA